MYLSPELSEELLTDDLAEQVCQHVLLGAPQASLVDVQNAGALMDRVGADKETARILQLHLSHHGKL